MGGNAQNYNGHPAAVYCSTGLELSFEFSTKIEFSTEIEFSAKINLGGVPSSQNFGCTVYLPPPQINVSTTVFAAEEIAAKNDKLGF